MPVHDWHYVHIILIFNSQNTEHIAPAATVCTLHSELQMLSVSTWLQANVT